MKDKDGFSTPHGKRLQDALEDGFETPAQADEVPMGGGEMPACSDDVMAQTMQALGLTDMDMAMPEFAKMQFDDHEFLDPMKQNKSVRLSALPKKKIKKNKKKKKTCASFAKKKAGKAAVATSDPPMPTTEADLPEGAQRSPGTGGKSNWTVHANNGAVIEVQFKSRTFYKKKAADGIAILDGKVVNWKKEGGVHAAWDIARKDTGWDSRKIMI